MPNPNGMNNMGGKLNQTMNVAINNQDGQHQVVVVPTKRGKTSSRDVTPPEHRGNTQSPQPGGMNGTVSPGLMGDV